MKHGESDVEWVLLGIIFGKEIEDLMQAKQG